jgi:hypothetical protein
MLERTRQDDDALLKERPIPVFIGLGDTAKREQFDFFYPPFKQVCCRPVAHFMNKDNEKQHEHFIKVTG